MEINLLVIMPIYNEEASIEITVKEWIKELSNHDIKFKLLLINDGSKDNTLNKIHNLGTEFEENILVIDKENTGHGSSCLYGYNLGFKNGYNYLMQIDSDGQCDPQYFSSFISHIKNGENVVYGLRYYRKDGFFRFLISRAVSIIALFKTGVWVWDGNVPYRIFKVECVKDFLKLVTPDFFLVNVLLAIYHKDKFGIKYVPIVFRDRHGGSPSLKTFSIIKHGMNFINQLNKIKLSNAK